MKKGDKHPKHKQSNHQMLDRGKDSLVFCVTFAFVLLLLLLAPALTLKSLRFELQGRVYSVILWSSRSKLIRHHC